MDYETREYAEMVPRQRTVTEYQERRYVETIPREVVTTDYYAIEHRRNYVPQVTAEAIVETTPVERIVQRTEYIPVEKYANKIKSGPSCIILSKKQSRPCRTACNKLKL